MPKRWIVVVAGNRREFDRFIRSRKIREHRDAIFASRSERLMGLVDPVVIFTGTYTDRPDLLTLIGSLRVSMLRTTEAESWSYEALDPARPEPDPMLSLGHPRGGGVFERRPPPPLAAVFNPARK